MRWLTAVLGIVLVASASQGQTSLVTWSTVRECKQKITTFQEIALAGQAAQGTSVDVVPKVSPEPTLTTLDVKTWRNGGIFKDGQNRLWWLYDGVPFFECPNQLKGWLSTSHNGNQYFMTENGRMFRRMH